MMQKEPLSRYAKQYQIQNNRKIAAAEITMFSAPCAIAEEYVCIHSGADSRDISLEMIHTGTLPINR